MIRVILFLAAVLALATGLSWLADQPGNVRIDFKDYVLETSLFRAVVLTALLIGASLVLWSLIRHIWHSPAAVGNVLNRRRSKQGLQAISAGMIAVGSGDRAGAMKHALLARKSLPNEPMTHLLRAQAAQLAGDKSTTRRIFEAMLASPDTEPLGLRGLFLEAEREKEAEAARHFAERALRLNPRLAWASDALFDLQCRVQDWAGALETLTAARKNGLSEKAVADRRRAVLLAAQAIAAEDREPDKALNLAVEAHNLAPDLVPAAAQAARMLASRGNTPKAAKIVERTWTKNPHPDLATVYAYARVGDSPRDRLVRAQRLAVQNPNSIESAIAVANAAIDAREFDIARDALQPMLDGRLTQRIATLMARIESEQHGDKGRVHEWLARAVNAQRDPAWTADGVVADDWSPISPVTGALDAFQWKVPVETLTARDSDLIARRVEELVALSAPQPKAAGDKRPIKEGIVTDEVLTVEAVTVKPAPTARAEAAAATTTAEPVKALVPASQARAAVIEPPATSTGGSSAQNAVGSTAVAQTETSVAVAPLNPAPTEQPARSPAASTSANETAGSAAKPVLATVKQADVSMETRPLADPAKAEPVTAAHQTTALAGSAASAKPGKSVTNAATSGTTAFANAKAPGQQEKDSVKQVVADAPRSGSSASNGEASKDATKLAKSGVPAASAGGGERGRDGDSRENSTAAKEPRIFVVPHAPDDPGPEGADADAAPPKGNRPPYRALP